MHLVSGKSGEPLHLGISPWFGSAAIVIGGPIAVLSILQCRKVLRSLKPMEIPAGYRAGVDMFGNVAVALLGIMLTVFLSIGEP
jgi:putative membrane protein